MWKYASRGHVLTYCIQELQRSQPDFAHAEAIRESLGSWRAAQVLCPLTLGVLSAFFVLRLGGGASRVTSQARNAQLPNPDSEIFCFMIGAGIAQPPL